MRSSRFALGVVLGIALATAGAREAGARELAGRLYLGPDLAVCLQEDESLVKDLLRAMSVVSAEPPVIDLTACADRPDQLVVGRDRKLYAADPAGGWARVGAVEDPSAIALEPGVRISLASDVLAGFRGDRTGARLRVSIPAGLPRVHAVRRMAFADWLDELGRLPAEGRSRSASARAFEALVGVLASCLPTGADSGAAAMESLRALKRHVADGRFASRTALEQLVKRTRKATQARLFAVRTPAGRRLLDAYESLERGLRDGAGSAGAPSARPRARD
jgi:hypothetical protein